MLAPNGFILLCYRLLNKTILLPLGKSKEWPSRDCPWVPEYQSTITAFCGNFICFTWSIAANEYFISCTSKKLPADTYLAETAVFDLSCLVLMLLLSKTAKIILNELCYPYAVPYCVVSTFHSCAVLMYLAAKGLLPHNSNWSWSHRF